MGSWPLPEVETRETRSLARAASCERTGPVFTAFRNAISSPWGGVQCNEPGPVFSAFRNAFRWVLVCVCDADRRRATHPRRAFCRI